jgi:mRNA interferase RelE/StbE
MGRSAGSPALGAPAYRVLWHKETKKDLARVPRATGISIVEQTIHRLSRAPDHFGRPLTGTKASLWRARFGKYRIVYTINFQAKKVWVLAVDKRAQVYERHRIEAIMKLASAIRIGLRRDHE